MKRDDTDERYAREQRFHDELVSEGRMRPAARFYMITDRSASFHRRLLFEAVERAERLGKARILEYGSGAGAYSSRALAAAGHASIGIDLSEPSVGVARERFAEDFPDVPADFRVMNAEALDFPDSSFEVISGHGILHHLDLDRAYAEIARVLAPGGTALFTEPLGHNPLINLYRRLTPQQRTEDEHPLRMTDLELARQFFGKVEAWYYHFFALATVPFGNTRAFAPLLSALDRVDRVLFDNVRLSHRYAWLAVLRFGDPLRVRSRSERE